MAAHASASSSAPPIPGLVSVTATELTVLYRQFNPNAPPPGHTVLRGQYDRVKPSGEGSDLHVTTHDPRIVKAVDRNGRWRGISLSEDLEQLQYAFKSRHASFYSLPVADVLRLHNHLQILRDPAREEHWGLSVSTDMTKQDFDALLEQAEALLQVSKPRGGGGTKDENGGAPPPDEDQSRYSRVLFAAWEKEQADETKMDEERVYCLYQYAWHYVRRMKEHNDANDFLTNPKSFKNHMSLRDRSYVAYAFRAAAKLCYDDTKKIYDDEWNALLLNQEAQELFLIPLWQRLQAASTSWRPTSFKELKKACIETELDLNDIVHAEKHPLDGYTSVQNFVADLAQYESEEEESGSEYEDEDEDEDDA